MTTPLTKIPARYDDLIGDLQSSVIIGAPTGMILKGDPVTSRIVAALPGVDYVTPGAVADIDALVVHLAGAETITGNKNFTAPPTVPTAALGTSTGQAASTAFVAAAVAALPPPPVPSVFGRVGPIVAQGGDYGVGQVTGAAPLDSPALTGTPTAPTAAPGTATTQLATCAFVAAGLTAGLATKAEDNAVVHRTGALAEAITGAKTFTTAVRIGTGSDPVGDANAGLTVATGDNTAISTLGAQYPAVKAVCTAAGGANVKLQAGPAGAWAGTESDHPFDLRTNNASRVSISNTLTRLLAATIDLGPAGAVQLIDAGGGNYRVVGTTITALDQPTFLVRDRTGTNISFQIDTASKIATFGGSVVFSATSSTQAIRSQSAIVPSWLDSTEATRKGRLAFKVSDFTGVDKEGLRLESDGTQASVTIQGPAYCATALRVGAPGSGPDNARAEVWAKDASSPIYAGYLSSGGSAAFLVDSVANLRVNKLQTFSATKAAPTVVGDAIDLALFTMSPSSGAGSYLLSLVINGSGYNQTKTYLINTCWQTSTTWRAAVPISSTGPYATNDCALDMLQTDDRLQIRLRRTAGTVAASATLTAVLTGVAATLAAGTGASSSVTPPTERFLGDRTAGTPGHWDIGGWAKLGTVADSALPNNAMAWSADTPGALKVRDKDGVLKTVTLT